MTQSNFSKLPDQTNQIQQKLFNFESPIEPLPELMVRFGAQVEKMPDRIKNQIHKVREWLAHGLGQ